MVIRLVQPESHQIQQEQDIGSLDGEIQLMKVHGIKQSVEQKIFMLNGKNNIV